ncbi:MAG: GT4 family glycosyltransferase PelF [Bacillota bacterium]
MIVCLIVEGSYPYISGGVASWIQQLIQGLPNIQFKIFSIMPKKAELKPIYLYPSNLIEVKTIFLDDYLDLKHKFFKKVYFFNEDEKQEISKFICLDSTADWKELFKIFSNSKKMGSAVDFLQSKFFWATILDLYEEKYNEESFNSFFWTFRSMFLPLLHLFNNKPPQADLYHAVSTGYAGIIGAYFRELTHKPFILTEHGIYAREREEDILKASWVTGVYKKLWIKLFYYISEAAYQQADKIIALFEQNRIIQIQLGVEESKTKVIPNGVNLNKFAIAKISHANFNIGGVMRVAPIKDVMTLIRAFRIIKNSITNAKLYIIGSTDEDIEYFHDCVNLISIFNLQSDVIITGTVDVLDYYQIMDVIVLTSISEGQPLVILEGMAAGIPIVATDVGSCRELLEENDYEGPCGVVTSLVSPTETAAAIINLWQNPYLRAEMGKNGQERIKRAYSEELFLKSYEEQYISLG